MAGSALEDGVQKHQKVYSFLKRTLPQDRYEGVRLIEPCVIVTDGFNKTFQFAVLGDEMLYITENPPKTSKDIKIKLDLACVTSVELIHDVAEFLGGDLKTKNQHILVEYKKISKPSLSSPSLSQSVSVPFNENSLSSRLALQASILSTSPVLRLKGFEQRNGKSPVLQAKGSMVRVESQPCTKHSLTIKSRFHLSASDSDLRNIGLSEVKGYSGSMGNVKASIRSPNNQRPLPPPPPGHESQVAQSNSNHRYRVGSVDRGCRKRPSTPRKRQKHGDKDLYDLDSSSSSTELEGSLDSFHRQLSADFSGHYRPPSPRAPSPRAPSPYDSSSRVRSYSNESTESREELDNSDDDNSKSTTENVEVMELHLYILTENSPMFIHLKSTWNNCILKSTLYFGHQRLSPATSPTSLSNKVDNSQLLLLFNQLKTEILQSHIMEKTFVLIQELHTAAEKSFNLKRYFWKSSDLFLFMVGQLQKYMPHLQRRSSRRKGNNREDELDFVVVLLQTFVCLFRETDVLSTRLIVIKDNEGRAIKDLLKTLIIHPLTTITPAGMPTISPAAQLLLSGADRIMFTVGAGDDETNILLKEILDSATSLLFELICVVHQANCFSVEDNVLNIFWLMKILEAQDQTKPFVERIMDRVTSLVSSTDRYLSPAFAVLLYKQLYVLKNFLEYSTVVANHIRVGYAEEFRYYIREPVVQKKLPCKFPLTKPTLELLEKITNYVLNKSMVKQPSFR